MAGKALHSESSSSKSATSIINDPRMRGIFYQVVTLIILVFFVWMITSNTIHNLQRANISSGFGFLNGRAGFDIGQTLIEYNNDQTFGRAFVVGLLNTLQVAILGIITASIIGFIVGIARLSKNWLVSKLAQAYVEIFRNVPPLLVIFFWYKGVITILPQARDSLEMPLGTFLNNRGFFYPRQVWGEGSWMIPVAFLVGIIITYFVYRWAKARQMRTGQPFRTGIVGTAIIIGLPLVTFLALGSPITFDFPIAGRFNLTGGAVVAPEFLSLYLALSFYTASFIAEIVRGGIKAVAKGQTEAASALGMRGNNITRLIVVPQAMRIIIPPLTSQYLNLTKNSSLAVAVGFSDLVAVGGTILNQTGQAVEVVAIWLAVYLTLSLTTALIMNWFNAKMALVER
ncbi:amino acid ABC transporter permease [Agrobacterium rubi]|uniref:Amino acid ABC transporter permease n=1 Tax=Agrobacterium rubi TaxID=28099 RepID=A0AAE7R877_9HYPH|nr:amino acid ABC transporter permease [Agrobacterium rubi]NTE86207.1 amino acid ABC transporter permease [Agrobacterium rubi]NTF02138.1 amino acid ABC transporter permease [Agrobacterium rubi]NTF36382.1 amino acid ABC transporter permease [Agrobacterium rubi]OCJ44344.1 amino acid ABC transporter permease [Agrobacterium rubi]QTG01457.1 amino acid ABC transporter permease [Agrobacterium rubi]